jgi:hypothetical protein
LKAFSQVFSVLDMHLAQQKQRSVHSFCRTSKFVLTFLTEVLAASLPTHVMDGPQRSAIGLLWRLRDGVSQEMSIPWTSRSASSSVACV